MHSDPQPGHQAPAPEQARRRWRSQSPQAGSTDLADTEEDQDGSQLELVSDSSLPTARELAASGTNPTTPGEDGIVKRRPTRARHPVALHLAVLLGYVAAGVAVTWPHATYLAGRLPYTRDAGTYVWNFWWIARSVEHLSNPWSTTYLAAPVGTELGLNALMPLAGVVMMPVTVLFGPSASYNLLCIALPGLLSYATYRVARLWLPSQVAAIAAGAFFGFSSLVDFWTWNHVNLAAGALFVPLALEAAVRLRRRPGPRQAVILGLVIGASVLVDQDSALMAAMLAVGALLPWLLGRPVPAGDADRSIAARVLSWPRWTRVIPLAVAGLISAVVASPQLFAIAHEVAVGGPAIHPDAHSYRGGASLPNLIEPSQRVNDLGLPIPHSPGFATYGTALTILAIGGSGTCVATAQSLGLGTGVARRHGAGHGVDPQCWHSRLCAGCAGVAWRSAFINHAVHLARASAGTRELPGTSPHHRSRPGGRSIAGRVHSELAPRSRSARDDRRPRGGGSGGRAVHAAGRRHYANRYSCPGPPHRGRSLRLDRPGRTVRHSRRSWHARRAVRARVSGTCDRGWASASGSQHVPYTAGDGSRHP